jgi:endonuclease YncB( thermonuclease family)
MRESRFTRFISIVSVLLFGISAHIDAGQAQGPPAAATAPAATPPTTTGPAAATKKPVKPQPRPHSTRVTVDLKQLQVDDGDTLQITWGPNDVEEVRILGIDCPETRHVQHDIPYSQIFGEEARAFARGTFATATKVELLRASMLDPYDRTLGYVFVNDKNYSVLVLDARLAEESITAFGDNGFPKEAAVVLETAKRAGPLPFEPPYQYRNRMRKVSEWMKGKGIYPTQ